MTSSALPLAGIRIIAMEQVYAAPLGTLALAALGAEVIKIESAPRPDAPDPSERANDGGYRHKNRSKRAIALDLQFERGRELFKDLVAKSDIVLDNYTRRVMANFGLDYENLRAVKSDLIMLSMTGYGHTGPYADYKAYGPNLEAMAGQVWLTGYEGEGPHRVGGGVFTDTIGGHALTLALLAALVKREKTGKGSHIDLSLYEITTALLGESLIASQLGLPTFEQRGNRHRWMAPHGCFACAGKDRWVVIAVETDAQWQALRHVLGEAEAWAAEPAYGSARGRFDAQDTIEKQLEAWTRQHPREDVVSLLSAAGVPVAPVNDARDVVLGETFWQRGALEWVDMSSVAPELGYKADIAPPWHFSEHEVSLSRPPPVALGEANQYVFGEILGMSDDEIAALEEEGVLSRTPTPRAPFPRLPGNVMFELGLATAYDADHDERIDAIRRRRQAAD